MTPRSPGSGIICVDFSGAIEPINPYRFRKRLRENSDIHAVELPEGSASHLLVPSKRLRLETPIRNYDQMKLCLTKAGLFSVHPAAPLEKPSSSKASELLRLPRELRDEIYHYLLEDYGPFFWVYRGVVFMIAYNQRWKTYRGRLCKRIPAWLSACAQLRKEACELIYKKAFFVAHRLCACSACPECYGPCREFSSHVFSLWSIRKLVIRKVDPSRGITCRQKSLTSVSNGRKGKALPWTPDTVDMLIAHLTFLEGKLESLSYLEINIRLPELPERFRDYPEQYTWNVDLSYLRVPFLQFDSVVFTVRPPRPRDALHALGIDLQSWWQNTWEHILYSKLQYEAVNIGKMLVEGTDHLVVRYTENQDSLCFEKVLFRPSSWDLLLWKSRTTWASAQEDRGRPGLRYGGMRHVRRVRQVHDHHRIPFSQMPELARATARFQALE